MISFALLALQCVSPAGLAPLSASASEIHWRTEKLAPALQEAHQQAEDFLARFREGLPAEEREPFLRVSQAVLRQSAQKAGQFVAKHGMPAAFGYFFLGYTFPAILLATGHPEWAALTFSAPLGPVGASLGLLFSDVQQDLRLKKALPELQLRTLRKFRDQMLEFDPEDRLFSVLYQTATDAAETAYPIDVLEKVKARRKGATSILLPMKTLEELAAGTEHGRHFLMVSRKAGKDSAVHGMRLLRFIDEDDTLRPRLLMELEALVSAGAASRASDAQGRRIRETLLTLQESKSALRKALQERKATGETAPKAPGMELQELEFELKKAEYLFLQEEHVRFLQRSENGGCSRSFSEL